MVGSLNIDPKSSRTPYDEIRVDSIELINELNRLHGWSAQYRQTGPAAFKGIVEVRSTEHITLVKEHYNARLDISCSPPPGMVAVILGVKGQTALRINGQAVDDTCLQFIWPGAETFICFPESGALYVAYFDASDFLQSLKQYYPSISNRISTSGTALYKCRRDSIDSLRTYTAHALYRPADRTPAGKEMSFVFGTMLLDTLATSLRHTHRDERIIGSRRYVAQKTRDYLEANYAQLICMDQLCRELHASIRTLERAFVGTFDTTIRNYIKVCRLNSAHAELIAAGPRSVSVTEIALNSGFNHLGRFSVEYKKLFNESPSVTLQR